MAEERYRIGELADRHGLSTAALRYYERLGLLGEPDRTSSGYRLYGPDEDERVRFIVRAKALDLSLDEIRSLLAVWDEGGCGGTRDELRHVLAHKIADVRRRASEAEAFAHQLVRVYERLSQPGAPAAGCGCVPDLPAEPPAELAARLESIAGSSCRCGGGCGRAGHDCGCACDRAEGLEITGRRVVGTGAH